MHTFYCNTISEQSITLDESESKHAIKVLRLNIGSAVRIIDGKGKEAYGSISLAHAKHCEIKITSINEHPPEKPIHIALAPTKNNDRIEWFLEKATELGLTEFTPIICTNSERKKFNLERWEKVILSAVKQAKRVWLPKINPPITFKEFATIKYQNKVIAHCEETKKTELKDFLENSVSDVIAIGPEGDFSPEEIKLALDNQFQAVSLGANRLRTETAGITACTLIAFS